MVETTKAKGQDRGDRSDGALGHAIAHVILGAIVVAIAAAIATPIFLLVRSAYDSGHLYFGEPTVQGVAVKSGAPQGFRKGSMAQDAVFTYTVEGKAYRRSFGGTDHIQKGDRITIHYDPSDPMHATGENSAGGYIFLTVIKGIGCLILGYLLYRFLRGSKAIVFPSSEDSSKRAGAKTRSKTAS